MALCSQLYGCKNDEQSTAATANQQATFVKDNIAIDLNDIEGSIDINSAPVITLNGNTAAAENNCAEITGSKVKITKQGVYVVTGTLSDGQIKMDCDNTSTVVIVLKNADITNKSGAAIHIKKALSAYDVALSGTKNTIADTSDYKYSSDDTDGEPDATLFSKSDLTIGGKGSINIDANYSCVIKCRDNLIITDSTINIDSVDSGIKSRDSLQIWGGNITVISENDGIKSTNSEDESLGDIFIKGGKIDVTSGTDGIQSEKSIEISGGDISIQSGSGAKSASESTFGLWGSQSDDESAKGLKAEEAISISSGSVNINSADDSIHSNNTVNISGGTLTLASGDDAIHADSTLSISSGDINVTFSYEGLEARQILISGGNISITSSDDGINAAGGNDSSNERGFGGGDPFSSDSAAIINVSGGYIYIDASGDGFDSNGNAEMSNGTLIINGPTDGGNCALDYNGSFNMSGGLLIASGSSQMAQAISDSSTQYCIMTELTTQNAGTIFNIQDSNGVSIVTYAPSKSYSNVVICSPDIKNGETYKVYTGGSATGDNKNGLYSGNEYTKGNEAASFTVSSIITSNSQSGGMGMGNKAPMDKPGAHMR